MDLEVSIILIYCVIILIAIVLDLSGPSWQQGTLLVDLLREDKEFIAVEDEMQNTIREHKDNGHSGGVFSRYTVIRVFQILIFI